MKIYSLIKIFFSLSLFLALFNGCATTREKSAFIEYNNAKNALYQVDVTPAEYSSSVELNANATLSDYLQYGALNNPELKAAFERWKAALEKAPQARSLPDPMLSYTYYMTEIDTRFSPPKNQYGLQQTFPWLEKLRLKSDAALKAAEAERWKFESMKLDLFNRVKQVYFETAYIAKAIIITEENIQLLRQMESVARVMYASGSAPFSTVIKAQVELGKLENDLLSFKDMIQAITAELNALLNRTPDAPLSPPTSIENPGFTLSDQDAFALASENNPDLRILDHEIEMRKINLAAAKKEFYPDITLGAYFLDVRESMSSGMGDSGNELMAMISFNIPLWFRKYRAGIREGESRFHAAQNQRQNRRNEILADIKMALYRLRDADRRISLYRNTLIPKARESLRVSEQAFTAGKTDFMNVIDAQRILLEFELSHERALADKNAKLAEIEKLLGGDSARAQSPETDIVPDHNIDERGDEL